MQHIAINPTHGLQAYDAATAGGASAECVATISGSSTLMKMTTGATPSKRKYYGLVLVDGREKRVIKIGPYRAISSSGEFAWTPQEAAELLRIGDSRSCRFRSGVHYGEYSSSSRPARKARCAIENSTAKSRHGRRHSLKIQNSIARRSRFGKLQLIQSLRMLMRWKRVQPFDTIVDCLITTMSGGQVYLRGNYDEKFEGTITLRRALAGCARAGGEVAEKVGSHGVDMTEALWHTTPLPLSALALGAADMNWSKHARVHGFSE